MDQGHLAVRFAEVFARHATRPATRERVGEGWRVQTFAQLGERVRSLAEALVAEGIAPGDRVAIFATNRPEWTTADLAILSARGVVVPIYPTSTPQQVKHILADSGAVCAFVEGQSELERLASVWGELPALRRVVTGLIRVGVDRFPVGIGGQRLRGRVGAVDARREGFNAQIFNLAQLIQPLLFQLVWLPSHVMNRLKLDRLMRES